MRSIDFKLLICLAPRGYYIRGYSSSVITPEALHMRSSHLLITPEALHMRSSNGFVTPEAPHLLVTPEALTPEAPTPEVITSEGIIKAHEHQDKREVCLLAGSMAILAERVWERKVSLNP